MLLAIPVAAVAALLSQDGFGDLLDGKAVIDAANNGGSLVMNSAELITVSAPGARYFSAFNTFASEVLAEPLVAGVASDMFFCGPAGEECGIVEGGHRRDMALKLLED